MKKMSSRFALACSLFVFLSSAYADNVPQYIQDLAGFLPVFKKNADDIWPGLSAELKHPLLVFPFEAQDVYAFDFVPQNSAWQSQVIKGLNVYHLQNDLIGAHDFMPSKHQPYLTVDNQSCIVVGCSPYYNGNNESVARYFFINYEFFSSPYAASKIALLEKQINTVYDTFAHPELVALLKLEKAALDDYLVTRNEDALKNYAAIFQYRYQLLDDNSRFVEVTAGEPLSVDEYVGYKAVAKNTDDLIRRLQDASRSLDEALPWGEINMNYQELLEFNRETVKFALDTVQPNWKSIVESTNAAPSMLLQKHYHLTADQVNARVKFAKTQYNYSMMMADINRRYDSYFQQLQALQSEYQNDQGIEFSMSFSDNTPIDMVTGSSSVPVNSSVTITPDLFKLSICSKKFCLNAKNIPVAYSLISDSLDDASTRTMKFKLPTSAVIITDDGAPLTVQQFVAVGKSVKFHALNVKNSGQGAGVNLTVNGDATLAVIDGRLQVQFTNILNSMASPDVAKFIVKRFSHSHKHA